MEDRFAEIRPYRDKEVAEVLARLQADPELLDSLSGLRFGRIGVALARPLRPVVRWGLKRQLADIVDVARMQSVIRGYMDKMIASTTAGFSTSGLEALEDGPYLFISNHRDIALDPAFTNYALHRLGRQTCRIAIGDNLLSKPWISDLMRLNKSFIVKRSLPGPRQLLAASRLLADYIKTSIAEEHCPIWIAQREGRAKDGFDATEPAVIKMLMLARDKSEAFGLSVEELRIVPVSISYELDPCDALKAHELASVARDGLYSKAEHEDAASIAAGISGQKGRVHIAFGKVLDDSHHTVQDVVDELDRQIEANYLLHPTNIWAWQMLNPEREIPSNLNVSKGSISRRHFEQRMLAIPEDERDFALRMYANPCERHARTFGD
ncbi:MAG: hypothetical protein RI942_2259 [Pseudomonadota bacterium]